MIALFPIREDESATARAGQSGIQTDKGQGDRQARIAGEEEYVEEERDGVGRESETVDT